MEIRESATTVPKIVAVEWFTGRGTVGMVLVETFDGGFKGYVGVALDIDREHDADFIYRWGAKLPRRLAEATFPRHIKKGVKYNGKGN